MEDNLALMRRSYELWNEGGPEAFATACMPDIVFTFDLRSIAGDGARVLAELKLHAVGPRSGAVGDAPHLHVARLEDGLIAELRSYGDPEQARREYERLSG